jgi:hypothetical protein
MLDTLVAHVANFSCPDGTGHFQQILTAIRARSRCIRLLKYLAYHVYHVQYQKQPITSLKITGTHAVTCKVRDEQLAGTAPRCYPDNSAVPHKGKEVITLKSATADGMHGFLPDQLPAVPVSKQCTGAVVSGKEKRKKRILGIDYHSLQGQALYRHCNFL